MLMLIALLWGGPTVAAATEPGAIPDFQLLRPDLAVAGQPTTEGLGRLKARGFRTVIDLCPQGQGLAGEREIVEAQGLHYVWIPVVTETFHEQDALAVGQFVRDTAAVPLLIHGSTADSAGAVWAVLQAKAGKPQDEALEEGKKAGLKSEDMLDAVRRVLEDPHPDLLPCLGCLYEPPRMVKNVRPQYPQDAFIKNIEPIVELEILIDATGRVAHARVVKSIPLLDTAALRCVFGWRFSPASRKGHPVAVPANAPVTFRIFDEKKGPAKPPKGQRSGGPEVAAGRP